MQRKYWQSLCQLTVSNDIRGGFAFTISYSRGRNRLVMGDFELDFIDLRFHFRQKNIADPWKVFIETRSLIVASPIWYCIICATAGVFGRLVGALPQSRYDKIKNEIKKRVRSESIKQCLYILKSFLKFAKICEKNFPIRFCNSANSTYFEFLIRNKNWLLKSLHIFTKKEIVIFCFKNIFKY